MTRPDLAALSVFATVASCRSFRAAARQLGLSPSAVSHAVSQLEERLGARLLARTTRSVAPTEAGQALLASLAPALAEIAAAVARTAESGSTPSGLLRITVPRSAVQPLFMSRFGAFASAFPAVTVEMHADNGFVDIIAEGFDAGLRFGESIEKDMIAVPCGSQRQRMILVAAPSFLARYAEPRHPRDLVGYPCITMRLSGGDLYQWEFEQGGDKMKVAIDGPLILNDNRLVLDAARAGIGLGFVLEQAAEDALMRGEVVRIMDDWCPEFPGFFLYYPSRRQMRPALRAFIDFFARG
jgi:DNA-binding transcriptional LysR family regulator